MEGSQEETKSLMTGGDLGQEGLNQATSHQNQELAQRAIQQLELGPHQ